MGDESMKTLLMVIAAYAVTNLVFHVIGLAKKKLPQQQPQPCRLCEYCYRSAGELHCQNMQILQYNYIEGFHPHVACDEVRHPRQKTCKGFEKREEK